MLSISSPSLGASKIPIWRRLTANRRGSVAVEMALIVPILVFLTVVVIEFVMLALSYQLATEATREGVRAALINDAMVNLALIDTDGTIVCDYGGGSVSCSPNRTVASPGATFQAILAAMRISFPSITDAPVLVEYSYSQVDTPDAPNIKIPLVTVKLTGVTHEWFTLPGFLGVGANMPLPAFSSTRLMHGHVT